MPRRRTTGRFHIGVGVDLVEHFAKKGISVLSVDTETGERRDLTPQECLEAVAEYRARGYEVVPSPDCDNYDGSGRCLGHPLRPK